MHSILAAEMRGRSNPDWSLYDLGIWHRAFEEEKLIRIKEGRKGERKYIALTEDIPALRSFNSVAQSL